MRNSGKAASLVLQGFRPLLELDRMYCEEIGRTIPIPTFPEDIILQVLEGAKKIFERTEVAMDLHPPFYVVGDIHGNIFDLLRILIHAGAPPTSRFLFLGDYVDRGEYSVEVVTLLFSLLVTFPDHIFMLRGNHEFESMNSTYGFSNEVSSQYQSQKLYDAFNHVFQWMPLVAVLDDQIFCVHGGVAPHAKTIAQLKKIKRPLGSYEGEFVADLVWSDPCQECKTFDESARGLGVQFGVKTLQVFLSTLKMKKMLRAHQCIQSGIGGFGGDLLYTIFSCSRYEGQANRCGLLFIDTQLQIDLFSLPPMDQIPRAEAMLQQFEPAGPDQELQISDALALNVKLFDGGFTKPKYGIERVVQIPGKKESLLQRFARTATTSCTTIGKLTRVVDQPLQRSVSADVKKLPRLVNEPPRPADV